MMMILKIKNVKPMKSGTAYYFHIPKSYIDNGVIQLNSFYDLDVNDAKRPKQKTRENQ